MTEKQRAAAIVAALENIYPNAECALQYEGEPWKLLVMGILSAQCTDKRVNIVCEEMFREINTLEAMAKADISLIEKYVRPCGLYKTKAKNISSCAKILVEKYNSQLPDDMDALLEFPGVGRKIANLLLGDIFGIPSVVTDTHCIRLASRMGLCEKNEKNPYKVEKALLKVIEPEKQVDFCHRMVFFGREYCTARSPKCEICPLAQICKMGAGLK
ncbi:MAG: endonuclease III [Clostridia bacterium]|nr:endonuclease III [Clostridia bacterium]